jgi:hypothetical protein
MNNAGYGNIRRMASAWPLGSLVSIASMMTPSSPITYVRRFG